MDIFCIGKTYTIVINIDVFKKKESNDSSVLFYLRPKLS